MRVNWQNKQIARLSIKNKHLFLFLFENGSLTRLIQDRCKGRFHIDLINESWGEAMSDEKNLLSLRNNEITFIRESYLKCNNKKLVYARTVIPQPTLREQNQTLTKLGQKPLGEILFKNNNIYRKGMKYAKIPLSNKLHKKAMNHSVISSEIYGRQSIFCIKSKPLLVIEIFLPSIMECNEIAFRLKNT